MSALTLREIQRIAGRAKRWPGSRSWIADKANQDRLVLLDELLRIKSETRVPRTAPTPDEQARMREHALGVLKREADERQIAKLTSELARVRPVVEAAREVYAARLSAPDTLALGRASQKLVAAVKTPLDGEGG